MTMILLDVSLVYRGHYPRLHRDFNHDRVITLRHLDLAAHQYDDQRYVKYIYRDAETHHAFGSYIIKYYFGKVRGIIYDEFRHRYDILMANGSSFSLYHGVHRPRDDGESIFDYLIYITHEVANYDKLEVPIFSDMYRRCGDYIIKNSRRLSIYGITIYPINIYYDNCEMIIDYHTEHKYRINNVTFVKIAAKSRLLQRCANILAGLPTVLDDEIIDRGIEELQMLAAAAEKDPSAHFIEAVVSAMTSSAKN